MFSQPSRYVDVDTIYLDNKLNQSSVLEELLELVVDVVLN